eukprot:CAMPEP_0177410486 /NCGR_PEP_ID=MMETSP0368-20130122/64869_1 /TAXON_ID=447022 ORGANISM="Scrippsiella hangoei-like, Strain SHHI-4" /NCGR_SAMPLE_ID=MMETSP0368 /ASSEMBLY_ACC=CAM_ASM_000363 /LENGTH=82 /DNA_ID=CAMNT_0018879457 /DNA_START=14 /DNA_END=260 /DNA_ORIENTATION=-
MPQIAADRRLIPSRAQLKDHDAHNLVLRVDDELLHCPLPSHPACLLRVDILPTRVTEHQDRRAPGPSAVDARGVVRRETGAG